MGNKIKAGQNKYWDLQSINVNIVWWKMFFVTVELFGIVNRLK